MPILTRRSLWPLAVLLLLLCRPALPADLYYLGQKIPDIQRNWTSADYQVLIDALKKIDETQVNGLPGAAASSPGRSTSAWSARKISARS